MTATTTTREAQAFSPTTYLTIAYSGAEATITSQQQRSFVLYLSKVSQMMVQERKRDKETQQNFSRVHLYGVRKAKR